MRGYPGSGKSFYIRTHHPKAEVCSADDFFIGPDGVYRFDGAKIREAHKWCMKKFITLVRMGDGDEGAKVPEIVVDNTHTQLWEFSGYVQIAEAFGYEVEIVRMDTPVDVAASRNLHGVPLKAVQSMADRFQKVLPWWKETVVKGI
jgi:predicted kinase